MSKHTPGPWELIYPKRGAGRLYISGVCEVTFSRKNPDARAKAEANMRLIAAAPEMLQMLKACVNTLRWLQESGVTVGATHENAEDVIAKAEGREK